MIWYYLVLFFGNLFAAVLAAFDVPKVEVLPFGIDSALISGVGYVHALSPLPWWMIDFMTYGLYFMSFLGLMWLLKTFRVLK